MKHIITFPPNVDTPACPYSIIITNDYESEIGQVVFYYNNRRAIVREFEVLKYDFGWQKSPFSSLEESQVYLQIIAICRNLNGYIIKLFSKKVKGLNPKYRIKKFITIPAKWIYHYRQWYLRVHGIIDWKA